MTELSTEADLWRVDPERLTSLLLETGWHMVGRRTGIYNRLAPPGVEDARYGSFVVPLDRGAPEYVELMQGVLAQVSSPAYKNVWARAIAPRLFTDPIDEFRFRKEAALPSGLISWRDGERLISSARRTLIAGAKSYVDPVRHFGNKHGQFANRYLDSVLMGQTEPGSYIVKALAPSASTVPLRKTSAPVLDVGAAAGALSRDVSESVMKALAATVEAISHFRSSGSLSGFDAGVREGISYEMTTAVLGIAEDADGSDITIEWDTSVPGGFDEPVSRYEFSGGDAPVLEKAAHRLAAAEHSEFVSVTGRVHLLARKEADSPGVFGVENLTTGQPRKVRVRLADDDEYHEAIHAYEENLAVHVSGRLEREGNLHWLYDAHLVRTVGHVEALLSAREADRQQITSGQMRLDELP
ncbi:hypothetical protein TPA0910_52490 [Streptomyces hygroscopicus subsp. sporocinereus]|uniref:TldD/PmbA family protein n=1 Tax=Streptomyces hygroscopicus TaxID=1912 RepID=A0ABQ3U6E9_STRHY|nr:hypothetical protein [Streptomyces hygroscopicus]GHJ30816.1 hypothetical protein TPA0910_52490 [Streptomyces hygroscopicus]